MLNGQSVQDKVFFQNMRFSGSGNLQSVPVKSVGIGCSEEDYQDFPKDHTTVAVIARNDLLVCNVQTKIDQAILNNATAVIMYNVQGSNTLFQAGLSTLAPFPIFAFGILFSFFFYFIFFIFFIYFFFIYFFNFYLLGYDLGNEIANLLDTDRVSMYSNNTQYPLSTSNIIADIKKGDASNTIGNYYYFLIIYLISFYFYFYFILIHLYFYLVSGSHLDSVLAGPGINDNGSGSSGNLGKQK